MRFEPHRPLVSATTSDAVPYVTVDAADPVEYSVPAALDVFKARHLAPRRRTRWPPAALTPNCHNAPTHKV